MKIKNEQGFTLIELMVVVLIIALLVALAVPTFLGARRRAQDRQAHSNLRNALVAEKGLYADRNEYTDEITALRQEESNLAWDTLDAGARGVQVEFLSGESQGVVLRSRSRSGALFCLADAGTADTLSSAPYTLGDAGTWYTSRSDGVDNCRFLLWESTSAGWE
jgi:type IV pilus assembly protein PilA